MSKISSFFSSLSVKRKVQYIFIFTLILCLVVTYIFFHSLIKVRIAKSHSDQNKDRVQSVEQSVNAIYENMDNMSKLIMFNNSVLTYLHPEKGNSQKSFSNDLNEIGYELQRAGNDIESLNNQVKALMAEKTDNYDETLQKLFEEMAENSRSLKEISSSVFEESNVFDEKGLVTANNFNHYRGISDELQERRALSEIYGILNSFPRNYSVHIFRIDDYNKIDLKSLMTSIGVSTPVRWRINYLWKNNVSQLHGGYYVSPNTNGQFDINTQASIVSFTRAINDLNTQKEIGMLVINFQDSLLQHTYSSFNDDSTGFAFVDTNGRVVCSSISDDELDNICEQKAIFFNNEYEVKLKNRLVTTKKLDNSDMILICQSEFNFSSLIFSSDIVLSIIFVIITISLTMIIISLYLNKFITSPLTKLSEAMMAVDVEYPPDVQIDTYNDEIGRLKECYNEMVMKINLLFNEVVKKEKERQNAEMKVIQEQIKPHFLYNTLEMIGCMALQNSREEVYDIVETLGSFYRNFLSKGNENITIAQEVMIIKDYLKLLKLRHDDAFDFDDEYEIQEDLNSMITLKLILQPLVENSIYHGIRSKGEHGLIKISIYSDDENVHFKVYDTGIGMSEEQINHLLNEKDERSFGFQATINRIQNYYQIDNVVSINSSEGLFCEVDIKIPVDKMR